MISGSCGRVRSQRAPLAATSAPPMCGLRWRQQCGARTARVSSLRCRPRPSSTSLRFSRRCRERHRRCGRRLLLSPLQPQGACCCCLQSLPSCGGAEHWHVSAGRSVRSCCVRQSSHPRHTFLKIRLGVRIAAVGAVVQASSRLARRLQQQRKVDRQPASSAAPPRASAAAAVPRD